LGNARPSTSTSTSPPLFGSYRSSLPVVSPEMTMLRNSRLLNLVLVSVK
jgi:hypothetical protein